MFVAMSCGAVTAVHDAAESIGWKEMKNGQDSVCWLATICMHPGFDLPIGNYCQSDTIFAGRNVCS